MRLERTLAKYPFVLYNPAQHMYVGFFDMKSMIESAQDMDYELDDISYVFRTTDGNYGAVWNNEEIEI